MGIYFVSLHCLFTKVGFRGLKAPPFKLIDMIIMHGARSVMTKCVWLSDMTTHMAHIAVIMYQGHKFRGPKSSGIWDIHIGSVTYERMEVPNVMSMRIYQHLN